MKQVPRPYTGNKDGVSPVGAKPGLNEFVSLSRARWGFTNLGTFSNRRMNNAAAKADPTNPKYLSVHATGRACDLGYKNRASAEQAWAWLLENAATLGIEEIHDYAYKNPAQNPKDKTAWGAGFRCSRGEFLAGVKIYDSKNNAGTPGGLWLHVEISPEMANDANRMKQAWNSVPAPANIVKTKAPLIKPKPAKKK
jgi:hypothetical protein